jgi:hypothetical protein
MRGLPNIQKMLKAAQEMQAKLQKELAELRVEGSSGGGMVTVELDGTKNMISLKIDPEVVNPQEVEMLQDLIIAAYSDAVTKVNEVIAEKLGALGPGFNLPGLF